MSALITGGSGFIGKHLVRTLKKRNIDVNELNHSKISSFTGKEDYEFIFFLSAYGNHYHHKEAGKIYKANVMELFQMLEKTKKMKYSAFIHFSSNVVKLPVKLMYSATKLAAENICEGFATIHNLPVMSVRPFSIYGPGEADFRLIPTIIRSIVKGEEMELDPYPHHDWIYIDDFISELMMCLVNFNMECFDKGNHWRIYEIGTQHSYSNRQVAKIINKLMGGNLKYKEVKAIRAFDTTSWHSDRKPFNKTRSLEEGLKETIKYYEPRYSK